jgi:chitin disaccharide deacetylase
MLLIINAEDLGADPHINDETFALMDAGLVTSANVLANGPAFAQAAAKIKQYSHCSFAVHLNLTAFQPLTRSSHLRPILDERGFFLSSRLERTPMTAALRTAIFDELSAQVLRVLAASVPVTHLDSHHHIHTLPKLFPVLKALQRRFRIRRIRSTINLLPLGERMAVSRLFKKRLFKFALRHAYRTICPDGLGEFRDFYACLTTKQIPSFQTLELMVHPGVSKTPYNREIDQLKSGWQSLLPPRTVLGNYHSLA